jgi:hypothetical protein
MDTIDPTYCPICQSPNDCAMEKARTTGVDSERCWCVNAKFTPEVLALLPHPAKGKACICAQCVNGVSDQQH